MDEHTQQSSFINLPLQERNVRIELPSLTDPLSTPESRLTASDSSRQSSPALSSCPTTPSMPQLDCPAQIIKPNVSKTKKRKQDELGNATQTQEHPNKMQAREQQLPDVQATEEEKQAQLDKLRQKEEEKARRQAVKEANAEKKRRALEKKAKEEKMQPKLNTFFMKPAPSAGKSTTPSPNPSRRPSITSIDGVDTAASPSKPPSPSEYERTFLPFCIQSYVHLAKSPFVKGSERLRSRLERIDKALASNSSSTAPGPPATTKWSPSELLDLPYQQQRGVKHARTVRQIMSGGSGVSDAIDLTGTHELSKHHSKFLCYHEDVRPPYVGTFTRSVSPISSRKLARNPFGRNLPETNYEYDSEAEWEPPQEGDEDLLSDEDDLEVSEDEDDLEGFLDDENDDLQRQKIVSDMQPISSGVCWDGDRQTSSGPFNLNSMRAELLLNNHTFPIDPYSTKYWPLAQQKATNTQQSATCTMQPPRVPLQTLSSNTISPTQQQNASITQPSQSQKPIANNHRGRASAPLDPKKQLKLVAPEVLEEFKMEIVGKNRTKIAMIEDLKERFPKISKDTIKDSLNFYAERTGPRDEKVWVWKSS